jgi:chromosome segregation ATPase
MSRREDAFTAAMTLVGIALNPDETAERLKVLVDEERTIEASLDKNAAQLEEIKVRERALEEREAKVTARENKSFDDQARLQDAQNQHAFDIEKDMKALQQEQAALAKEKADARKALDAEWKNLHEQADALEAKAKELVERAEKLDDWEKGLNTREQGLNEAYKAHVDRLAKLRELVE